MKKIILTVLVVSALLLSVGFVIADKPTAFDSNGVEVGWESSSSSCITIQDGTLLASDGSTITTGYDQWGYNYQAHMFNGGYCDAYRDAAWCQEYKDISLIMKWNDAWLSNVDCDGDGKLDRHFGYPNYIGSGAWLTNHQAGSYLGNWDLTGTYTIVFTCTSGCSGDYPHTMTINVMDLNTGEFSGTGKYIPNPGYTWDVTGTVSDSSMTSHLVYTGLNPGYYVDLTGTIDSYGSMSGTATSSSGQKFTWKTSSGVATGETCNWNYFVKIIAAPADATLNGGSTWYTADGTEIGPAIWGDFAIIEEVNNDPCAGLNGLQFNGEAPTGFGFYFPSE